MATHGTSRSASAEDDGRGAALARWTVAAVLVVAVHALGAFALINREPEAGPEGVPQAPILIDLAPPAAAPEVAALEDAQPAEEPVDAPTQQVEDTTPEAEPEAPPPEPEAVPEPVVPDATPDAPTPQESVEAPEPVSEAEPEPVEQPAEPEPEQAPPPSDVPLPVAPPERPAPEVAAIPEVPLPTARPTPPRPVREAAQPETKRETPRRQTKPKRETPEKTAAKPRQRRSPAPSTASQGRENRKASQGATVSRAALATWQSAVQARLNRYKRTPRGAGQGTVRIAFSLSGSGGVTSVRVVGSSGNRTLDAAAAALVRRASPFPAPPGGRSVSLTVPVRFR